MSAPFPSIESGKAPECVYHDLNSVLSFEERRANKAKQLTHRKVGLMLRGLGKKEESENRKSPSL
jgi:hypothetical protein